MWFFLDFPKTEPLLEITTEEYMTFDYKILDKSIWNYIILPDYDWDE